MTTRTTTRLLVRSRPNPAAWRELVVMEARLLRRDRTATVVPLALPVLILVMNGLMTGAGASSGDEPWSLAGYVVPMTSIMVIGMIGSINLPAAVGTRRESGLLRRRTLLPIPPALALSALAVVYVGQAVASLAIAALVARQGFAVTAPRASGWAAVVVALAIAATFAVGALVGSVAPTATAALGGGLGLFLTMTALGGGLGPRDRLPAGLAALGEVLPFGAAVEALGTAWTGGAPRPLHLIALASTAVVAGAAAAHRLGSHERDHSLHRRRDRWASSDRACPRSALTNAPSRTTGSPPT